MLFFFSKQEHFWSFLVLLNKKQKHLSLTIPQKIDFFTFQHSFRLPQMKHYILSQETKSTSCLTYRKRTEDLRSYAMTKF